MATGTIKTGSWKLLWTNPNPSTAFAAQTVSLDLSQYSEICIEFRHFKEAENFYTPAIQFVGYTGFLISFGNATPSGAMQYHQRRYAINANGVTFGDNTVKAFAGTAAATTENNNNIPVYIYAR